MNASSRLWSVAALYPVRTAPAELGTLAAALGALAPACAHAERTLAELAERFRLADTLVPAARRALPLRAGAPAPEPAFE
jgi:hypothetical protein